MADDTLRPDPADKADEELSAGDWSVGSAADPQDVANLESAKADARNGLGDFATGDEALPEIEPGPPDWESEAVRYRDLYLRALAEEENVRRRFRKEQQDAARFAAERLIKDLLPVLDNLNLALSYADPAAPAVKALAEGVRMTLKGCLDLLAEHGLAEVRAERGQAFDPNLHEALGQEPDAELPDKAVTREVARGYSLYGRLIRPAKVLVAKN
ncbi:MAG: nucleotide exchange factor GrpE [Deltaproteobacteria bacterium]|jgi:molecular chaperone GrpE|nr:nucleotide exchange factor GrpE [Deltaproteobacteria bacterium]